VVIGFNGSEKPLPVGVTIDSISTASSTGYDADAIWRAVLLRAARHALGETLPSFNDALNLIVNNPEAYATELGRADDTLLQQGRKMIIVFDALDRLASDGDWTVIRRLTKALLMRALAVQSFRSIRTKIFMRVDQFGDEELFRFPDGSKIRNAHVNLEWPAHELYGLLLFELLKAQDARTQLAWLADQARLPQALPTKGQVITSGLDQQQALIAAIAGEFMGANKKRGRVYTWLPLHLSDAAGNCSPRSFLTAWQSAAQHLPAAVGRAVDHLGLQDGVRHASHNRLSELQEDYPWINMALEPLRRQFVPIPKDELTALWTNYNVVGDIVSKSKQNNWLAPIDVFVAESPESLLRTMIHIGVMEQRANGKINVPDIFRVEAEILRKGGVAVPRRKALP